MNTATHQQPDSQKAPFNERQIAWMNEKYGRANFRDPETKFVIRGKSER